ncbi:uncharacterized protein [Montipora capricornis]|uniref:uncharacterized protein isoform X2 n=1 Tax=Montipora capricornis TaxID=246305 RepID=UPI0035F12C4A
MMNIMQNNISTYSMNKSDLEKLSKSELIKLIIKQNTKPVPAPRTKTRPIPKPRKSVQQMVQNYEENIILPPLEFRDGYKPVPAPRTKKPVPAPRTKQPIPLPRTIIQETNKALKGFTKSYEINIKNSKDPLMQLQNTRKAVAIHIEKILKSMKGLKFIETLRVTFEKQTGREEKIIKTAYFNSQPQTITNDTQIELALSLSKQVILNKIAVWISEGSGWTVQSVDNHYLNVVKYEPMKGSSYIKLPNKLKHSAKGLINMKNEDNECFRWCHIRHLNPQDKDAQRIKKSDKAFIENLNYSGIEFPVTTKQYNKIEKQNEININVFGYENKQKYPIYVSKEKYEDCMNLLLITENENKHYVLIKDFNKFMYDITKHEKRKHFCMYCLQHFTSERVLNNHKENCIQLNGAQAIKMPTKDDNILKFNNFHKQLPVPFVIYADFEAITEKIHGCQPNDDKSYTEAYQRHTDCGYGYKVVCCYDDKYTKPVQIYRGEKAVHKFMENMLNEVRYCKNVMKKHFDKPLRMTKDDEDKFKKADKCHICEKEYNKTDVRVRDHCHVTGQYRGSAHQDCNLNFRITDKIPVIFHNLRGYDSHFIMQEIGETVKNHTYTNKKGEKCQMNINAIPNNMEKYMAFMLGHHLTFIDSFQFMSSSLDRLVSNLPKESLKYTSQIFENEKLDLMSRKGVYPYDFMDSFGKFNEKLPPKEEFYSILNDEHISDDQYKHAQNVWNTFNLKNMGLSWDAMLKMTNIKLELMTDIDMFQFIEKGMRGGTSYIANRYGKANNKYMKTYDEKAPSKYIMYLDANNLYGWAMSQYLPTGGFRWLNKKQIDKIDLSKYKTDSNKGSILEVDLEYPKELHDLHNDYPLAPEKVKVNKDMLSNYCQEIADKFNVSTGLVHKLVPTLSNKEKYVLHYRNLQLYTDLGLKITKVHRVLEFNQSAWLKQYIDFNTEKRTNAENAFEKDFFKLMNNSVFGKTMENIRKRVDVRLVTDENKLLKMAAKPTYVSSKIFNENLVAVHKIKETLTLNRPAYVGMCILDLSKTLMYDFHYNYIKQKYGSKAKLLFTDTDSLTYEIQTSDAYQDFWNDKDKFDNSDYSQDSQYFDKTNKKVIGKFKDEAAGIPITEFVGLRSKMYSYMKDNDKGGKTAKGIKKNIIKKNITHENYKNVLFNSEQMQHTMKTIRSNLHQLGSYELNKVSLSCFDDKRYIHNNGMASYAYGHYKIHSTSPRHRFAEI